MEWGYYDSEWERQVAESRPVNPWPYVVAALVAAALIAYEQLWP